MIEIKTVSHAQKILRAFDQLPISKDRNALCGIFRDVDLHFNDEDLFRYTKTNGHYLVSFSTDSTIFHETIEKFYFPTDLENGVLWQNRKEREQVNISYTEYPNYRKIIPTVPVKFNDFSYVCFHAELQVKLLKFKYVLYETPKREQNFCFYPNYATDIDDKHYSPLAEIDNNNIILQMPMTRPKRLNRYWTYSNIDQFSNLKKSEYNKKYSNFTE